MLKRVALLILLLFSFSTLCGDSLLEGGYLRLYEKKIKSSRFFQSKNQERIAILFCGWCGMGKSTISKRLAKHYRGIIIKRDDFGERFGYGKSKFFPYFSFVLDRLEESSTNRFLILDYGVLGEKVRDFFYSQFEERGYECFFVCLELPKDIHRRRLFQRNPNSKKGKKKEFAPGRARYVRARKKFEFDYTFDNSSSMDAPFAELVELINRRLGRVEVDGEKDSFSSL